MEAPKIRILVVDDYTPWCRFVCSLLEKRPEFQVVGEVSDGLEGVQKAQELRPNLILLDIGLPSLSGIEAARRIRKVSPTSTILFVSANRSWGIAQEAMRTGGGGYVVKSNAASELLPAIEAVLQGEPFLSDRLTGHDPALDDEHASSHARHEKVVVPSKRQNLETNRHELRLYPDDAAFVGDLAYSIEAALETGNAVVVIATESHRASLIQQLRAASVDIDAAAEQKLYIPLDVSDSVSTVMETSTDGDRFAKVVPHAIVEALRIAKERHLHLAVG